MFGKNENEKNKTQENRWSELGISFLKITL